MAEIILDPFDEPAFGLLWVVKHDGSLNTLSLRRTLELTRPIPWVESKKKDRRFALVFANLSDFAGFCVERDAGGIRPAVGAGGRVDGDDADVIAFTEALDETID